MSFSAGKAGSAKDPSSVPSSAQISSIQKNGASSGNFVSKDRPRGPPTSYSVRYLSSVKNPNSTQIIESPSAQAIKSKDTIHKAAERGATELVQAFIKKKKSVVNSREEGFGHTPLHLAALHNFYEIVELLIKNECDLNIQDNFGWTALHFAASGKNEKLLKLLLDQDKIDVTLRNETLNTPLHYAAKNLPGLSKAVLKLFIDKGADINAQNASGETPLHGAAMKSNHQILERLLELGAKPDISTNEGETPLNWATKAGDERTISVLLRGHKHTSDNLAASTGSIPIHISSHDRSQSRNSLQINPGGAPISRDSSSNSVAAEAVSSDLRYELTFLGSDLEVVLNDDTWDQCLYEGGVKLLARAGESPVSAPIKNPHFDGVKREDVPLSKLFHLYLVISGRNKTDPEIVHWIVDFLTGPKKIYLLYLIDHYSYRIRVRPADKSRAAISVSMKRYRPQQSDPAPALDIWQTAAEKDKLLYDSMFEQDESSPVLDRPNTVRDRSVSLWEHRKISKFHWEISPTDLDVRELLGRGSFGVVYRARWMGVDVAVKKLNTEDMGADEYREFLGEISMVSNLRHPNVLMLLGGCLHPPNLCFVTEYMPQGSLDRVLLKFPHLDWIVRLGMAVEIARGLLYLHMQTPPILHRDLKSLNILVDENFHVKVADFGLSVDKTTDLNAKMGTLNWVAPEMLDASGRLYDEKADMYSFGMILWELVAGRVPYAGMSQLQILRRIDMRELETIPEGTDPRYEELIRACWHFDPSKRPSIVDALHTLEQIAEIEQ